MVTRAADPTELIPGLCRQFSRVTGWQLRFTPAAPNSTCERGDPAAFWTTEIHDGWEQTGWLSIAPPEYGEPPADYEQVLELAAGLGQLLCTLASAARRLESQTNDVSTLVHLGLAVPVQENLAWALTQVLRAAVQLTATRSAAFFLLDATTSRLKLRAVYQIAPEEIPRPERELHASPHEIEALAGEASAVVISEGRDSAWLPATMRSALCVAVQSETMPIGTLWVFDRRARDFSDRDVHALHSIASQIAAVLERVALLRTSEAQERIRRDLKYASESQPVLTPHDFPEDPRFEVAAHVASCHELGGDLCEVLPISDDEFALVVGDASGNSIPAALIMSAVRGALRTHPATARDVAPLMARLNNALFSLTRAHQFMSLCYGVYDAAARRFVYSNAGHPPPLLVRRGEVTPLHSHGLLLGVMRDVSYKTSAVDLAPGDLLVCYSDGISEARSGAQQMFRSEGIAAAILGGSDRSAQEVLHGVWNRVESHIAGGAPGDDRTLLVLKVC